MKFHNSLVIILLVSISLLFSCQREASRGALSGEEGKVVSSDDVSIHYNVYGQGEIALVFVHGWCTDMSIWAEQIPSFFVNYKLVSIDLPGHGKSGLDRKIWTMEAFGRDVVAVVEQLDLKKVVLVGHSMGGPVILETARLIPERVLGLIGSEAFSDLYVQKYSFQEIEHSLAMWEDDFVMRMREFAWRSYFNRNSDRSLIKRIGLKMAATPPDIALGSLEELLKYDGSKAFQEIQCPVREISSDILVPTFKVAEVYSKSLSVDSMPGAGHFIMLEDPIDFNRLLAKHISEFVMESYK